MLGGIDGSGILLIAGTCLVGTRLEFVAFIKHTNNRHLLQHEDTHINKRPAAPVFRAIYGSVLAGGVAAMILLYLYNPAQVKGLPQCPSLATTGYYCPGCGSTRATHQLLHGTVTLAWRYNPAMVLLGIPAGLFTTGHLAAMAFWGRPIFKPCVVPGWIGWAVLAGLVAYTVVRNLPYECFEPLRPPEQFKQSQTPHLVAAIHKL